MTSIASTFPPANFWLIVFGYLALCGVVTAVAFWLVGRFAGSAVWAIGGLMLGAMASVSWSFALLPAGAAVGALVGGVLSVVLASFER